MASNPRITPVELGGGRPASGDSARAALVNPVSQMEATNRAKGPGGMGAVLEGASKLAFGVAGIMHKQDVDRDQITAVEVEGRAMRQIDEDKAKLDPMAPDYAEQVKELVTRHTQGVMAEAQFRTRDVRDETQRRLAKIGAAAELIAVEDRRKSIAGEAERVYLERLDTLYGQIRKDPNASETYMAAFQADAARLRSGISPDRLRIISHAAADGMLAAKVEGYAQSGNFAMARKYLDENSGAFKPETNRQLRSMINAEESRREGQYIRGSAERAAGLRIDIIKQSQDPDAPQRVTIEALDREVASGRIRRQDADSLYAQLAVGDRQRNVALDANRTSLRNWEIGAGTADDAERVFRMALGEAARKKGLAADKVDLFGDADALKALDIVVEKGGVVPTSVSRQIENLANSGGPGSGEIEITNLAKATMVYKAMRDKYPNAKWGFEKNDRLDLVIEQAKANGGDVAQAARDVMKRLPDQKTDALRIEEGRHLARTMNWATEGREVLGDWLTRNLEAAGSTIRQGARISTLGPVTDMFGGSLISRGQEAVAFPSDMQAELRANFERHYRLSGNADVAKKAAIEQVKREWQVTYVAGDKNPYLMKNPPASFLPPERSWLRDDLDGIMAKSVAALLTRDNKPLLPAEKRNGRPGYILEADAITQADAAAKRPVSFGIKMLTEDGLYHVVTARVAIPTDDELRKSDLWKDRVRTYDDRKGAQDARDTISRAVEDRARRRRKE